MHTVNTEIPELEALLEQGRKQTITPEIVELLRAWYKKFADSPQCTVQQLADYINAEHGTELNAKQLTSWYSAHGRE